MIHERIEAISMRLIHDTQLAIPPTTHVRNHMSNLLSKVMSLKIYFAGSIRAGRADAHIYAKIVDILKKYGSVLTEHVGNPNMTEKGSHY